MDKAGRLVLPKALRDQIGLRPGEVDVYVDGSALLVQPVAQDVLSERGDRLVLRAAGGSVDTELVRSLRDAGQR